MRVAIGTLALLLSTLPAAAQIGLYTSPDGDNDNCSGISPNSYSDIYVVVTGEWTGARFFIPNNDCVFPNYPFAIEPLNGATLTGDFDSGFEMTFEGCTPGPPLAVARVSVFAYGALCCEALLSPHPNAASGMIELVDCSGGVTAATWSARVHVFAWWISFCYDLPLYSPPPRSPFPPDGATDVPLSLTLTWGVDHPYGNCSDISGRRANVYFGTNPNPPLFAEYLDTELNVGPLQPSTTYYWKVWVWNYGAQITGPVWSFRTALPVATTPTTWGRVKALYR